MTAIESRDRRETSRSPHAADTAAADEIWSILRMLFGRQKRRFLIAASALDLHPGQAGALMSMTPGTPLPMHQLADQLGCDNSNVTGIADRLEARGLIARQPYEQDRRVKHIVLTPKGAKVRQKLAAEMGGPPEGLARLSPGEQRQLRDLLHRVLDA
jgi:DNA-binding MarR family transcriptional regulator